MGMVKSLLRKISNDVFNVDIFRTDKKIIHLIDNTKKEMAWFSYSMQIQNFLEERKIDLIIDVGANRGQFAQDMANLCNIEVFSFEPVSKMYADLVSLSKKYPQVKPQNFAVGEVKESREINVYAHDTLSSFHEKSELGASLFKDENAEVEKELVNIVRLDDYLIEKIPDIKNRRIFLKTDTQGFDISVIKSAEKIYDRVFAIQSELSLQPLYKEMPHWTESISFYEDLGFSLGGFWPILKKDSSYIEADCLFVKPGEGEGKLTKFHVI